MTREEALVKVRGYLTDLIPSEDYDEVEEIMSALEQEPCGDCVSRQAVLNGIDTYINKAQSTGTQDALYSFAELVVKELPSVTPQQRIGRWEYVQYDGDPKIGNWHCSNCRLIVNFEFEGVPYYLYCPGCGAKMWR